MKNKLGITLTLSLCLLTSTAVMADDAIWGALIGGGAGAAVGGSVSGRNGAIIGGALGAAAGAVIGSENHRSRVDYVPAQAYRPQPVYYTEQPVYYYSQPVRVVAPPVYYIEQGRDRNDRRHHHKHGGWDRRDYERDYRR